MNSKTKKTEQLNKRNPEETRQRILSQATHFFAKSGYRGTSLSQILLKAKVNKRMVYHYFGSKEKLYRIIHFQQWQLLASWFAKALPLDGKQAILPRDLLFRAIEIFHEFSAAHQDFVRLLMWDGLEGGTVSRSIWEEIRGPLYRQVEALLQEAQRKKLIAATFKVDHLIVSFMGAILFYFAYANSLEDIFGKDPLNPGAVQQRQKQIMALFERILV